MPTYPYACTACGHAFEVQQSFTDPSLTECPECQGRLRKVFSSVGVVFKGSGFYRTDSRSGSGAGAKAGDGATGTSGSGTSGSGTANGATKGSTSEGSGSSSSKPTSTPAAAKPAPAAAGS